jgi:hypothetical protein
VSEVLAFLAALAIALAVICGLFRLIDGMLPD